MSKENLRSHVELLKNSQSHLTLPEISKQLTGNVTAWLFGDSFIDLVLGYSMKPSEWYSEAKTYLECYYLDRQIDPAVTKFLTQRYEKMEQAAGIEPAIS